MEKVVDPGSGLYSKCSGLEFFPSTYSSLLAFLIKMRMFQDVVESMLRMATKTGLDDE